MDEGDDLDEALDDIDWSGFVPRHESFRERQMWRVNRLASFRRKRMNVTKFEPREAPYRPKKGYRPGSHGTMFWDKHHGRGHTMEHWSMRFFFPSDILDGAL